MDDALKAIAAQAKATLPKKEHIHLSAHMLRHTDLRKAAEKDIRYAMKLSGHSSTKYIWRYSEPGEKEFMKPSKDSMTVNSASVLSTEVSKVRSCLLEACPTEAKQQTYQAASVSKSVA
ncbi:MAG: hypothetical protein AAF483_21190 [Planctomycetota bacterium]